MTAVASNSAAVSRIWLITFTDMAVQMLAFFVLLFSMSRLDVERYQAMVKSYLEVFGPAAGDTIEMPGANVVLPSAPAAAGDELGYLEAVLSRAIRAST
jgi:chemotaxis protein MotB